VYANFAFAVIVGKAEVGGAVGAFFAVPFEQPKRQLARQNPVAAVKQRWK